MSVAAVALAASGVMVLVSGPASAKSSGPKGKTTCTTENGSVSSGYITIGGCSSTGTPGTGSSSEPISISLLANGGPVDWVSGAVTTFAKPALATKNAKHCPGYVKGAASEPSVEQYSGSVVSDNSGLKMPGKFKGAVCISTSGTFSASKPLKLS
jgi:hypothetical protein